NHLRHQTPNHSVRAMKFESLSAWRRFSVEEPQSSANFIRNESEPKLDADEGRIASRRMLLDNFSPRTAAAPPNWFGGLYGGKDQHGREARGGVGGDGTLPIGQTSGEGADP
ncbi:hypothetical protein, partial [Bradyrhizobium sp. 146]|uniref:hypothetical protein n=1 Tax=Bradyrhizobium sp. 146 TaxID=2782622 RepID=UPI001FFBE90B